MFVNHYSNKAMETYSLDGINIFSIQNNVTYKSSSNGTYNNQLFKIVKSSNAGNGLYQIRDASGTMALTCDSSGNGQIYWGTTTLSDYNKWVIVNDTNGHYRIVSYKYPILSLTNGGSLSGGTQLSLNSNGHLPSNMWELRLCLDVPLHMQETQDTCSAACGIMALRHYGVTNVTESQFYSQAGNQPDFAYAVRDTINYYLSLSQIPIQYRWVYSTSYDNNGFLSSVMTNLANYHPILLQINTLNCAYFPYHVGGHCVIIVGVYYDYYDSAYKVIINDPHYDYCEQRAIPLVVLLQCAKEHGGCTILVE